MSLVVSLIAAAALCVCHLAMTLHLQGILNPTFDPFWVPRLLFPPAGFHQRYRWTLYYAGALVSPLARRMIFEDIPYDFRARVSRRTMVLVALYVLLTLVTFAAFVVAAVLLVRTGVRFWQQLPETVPEYQPPPVEPPPM
jgi:hypothetical protein